MRSLSLLGRLATIVLPLLTVVPAPIHGRILISELMAVNDGTLQDEDGEDSDWLELTNTGTEAVNMTGWYLTDDAFVRDKWQIPAVSLGPGAQLLVFASNKDRRDPTGELHTNFRLTSGGEFLALVRPDGATIEHAYAPAYPPQFPDVSYGVSTDGVEVVTLLGGGAPVRYLVPADGGSDVNNPSAVPAWNDPAFDDAGWTSAALGVGYVRGAGEHPYDEFVTTDSVLEPLMDGVAATAYLRVPFEVPDPSRVEALTLLVRSDDGFAAYLNGGTSTVASRHSPADGDLAHDSQATADQEEGGAVALTPFPIDLAGLTLEEGANLLALHGMNVATDDSEFLLDCELEAVLRPPGDTQVPVYMSTPTPGSPNADGVESLGPIFRAVTEHVPAVTLPGQSAIVVTAEVEAAADPVTSVRAIHRVMFGGERSVTMLDDGVPPDATAADGTYTATLPLAGLQPGLMFRWRFEASDQGGATSREPLYNDPRNSGRYHGTIAEDSSITSELPVVHWFVQNPAAADTRSGTRASAWFRGEFYDNFFVRIRGGSTSGFPKKSYKFDFNTREHFRFDPVAGRAEEINLNQTWSDKAYIRQPLSFELYNQCGAPGSTSYLVRLHRNGQFHALNVFVEQPDKRLLKREGLNDAGALYKMFNAVTSGTSGVEKKNRKHENNSDLSAFVSGVNNTSGAAFERFVFDNVNVPRQLNYLVATVLTQNNDNMKKNFYLYRDSDGTGEWFQLPWDTDLTWGSHFMTNDSSADDGIWATADYVLGGRNKNAPISPSHPFVGTQALPGNRSWNRLINKLHGNPRFAEMFRRRLRTVMDDHFSSPVLDDRIAELRDLFPADANEDRVKWGQFGQAQSLAGAIRVLESRYLAPRREHLFETHLASNAGSYPTPQTSSALLPPAQSGAPVMEFGDFDENPASGSQDDEFLELRNPNAFAVDLTGWTVAGGVTHEFLAGTVIEANGSLYLSPDVPSFRTRASSPRGREGRFVQGDYEGQISARGETIVLLDRAGGEVASVTTPSNPSEAQQFLRITEMHYAPPGGTDEEFIELVNIGPSPLNLEGVTFTQGVTFTFGAGVMLAPGEIGLLVREPANFPGANILGVYVGGLQNSGEQVTLRDAVGENILSFEYHGDWFPPARSAGHSIEILDENAAWDSWDDPLSWALSCEPGGSPGLPNPPEHAMAYEAWQRMHFSPAEILDPETSGPDADASGDGVSNLMKYALALDPKEDTREGLPEARIEVGSVVFSFTRWKKAVDLDYVPQRSADLLGWSTLETDFLPPIDRGDGTELVQVAGGAVGSTERQFYRLRVVKMPE